MAQPAAAPPTAVMTGLKNNVREAVTKNLQQPSCGWENNGRPNLRSVTLQLGNAGPAKNDIHVVLQKPARKIWLASLPDNVEGCSIYWHLDPIGNRYTTNQIVPSGFEPWISMVTASGTNYRTVLKSKVPISEFYLDVGWETGAADHNLTFLLADDDFDVEFIPQVPS